MNKIKIAVSFLFLLKFNPCLFAQAIKPNADFVKTVLDNISTQIGIASPKLEINSIKNKTQIIARYTKNTRPTITVDEKLVQICRAFGKDSFNAISIFISHELAHCYLEHNWCSDFAFAMTGENTLSKKLLTISKADKCAIEAQADSKGIYFATLAGYNPYKLYNRILDTVYKVYKLPAVSKGYPTLKERKDICGEDVKKVTEGIALFNKGVQYLNNRKFEQAITNFELLIIEYPTRENLNNLGLAYALSALETKPISRNEKDYPFEIDYESRLLIDRTRGNIDNSDQIDALLKKAKLNFEKAIAKDALYYKAYINLACVYDLLGNKNAALGKLYDIPEDIISKNEKWEKYKLALNNEVLKKSK